LPSARLKLRLKHANRFIQLLLDGRSQFSLLEQGGAGFGFLLAHELEESRLPLGHFLKLHFVEEAFGADVDYAQLVKLYGTAPEAARGRYNPAECIGARKEGITGQPDAAHISTSYVERVNLTMRMQMSRFTGLTNAFSKKFENHAHMVALYALWYNFVHQHKTPRMSPAMAAGVSKRLWSMTDIAEMVEAAAPKPGPRSPYKKRRPKFQTETLPAVPVACVPASP